MLHSVEQPCDGMPTTEGRHPSEETSEAREIREAIEQLLVEGKLVRGTDGRLRASEFAAYGKRH
jgi:hypothetical protein